MGHPCRPLPSQHRPERLAKRQHSVQTLLPLSSAATAACHTLRLQCHQLHTAAHCLPVLPPRLVAQAVDGQPHREGPQPWLRLQHEDHARAGRLGVAWLCYYVTMHLIDGLWGEAWAPASCCGCVGRAGHAVLATPLPCATSGRQIPCPRVIRRPLTSYAPSYTSFVLNRTLSTLKEAANLHPWGRQKDSEPCCAGFDRATRESEDGSR